jgi:hypothetical protein
MVLIDYRDRSIGLPGRRVGQRALAEATRNQRLDTPKRRPLYYRGNSWALWVCDHPLSPAILIRCQVMRSMILALNLLVLIQLANSRYLE